MICLLSVSVMYWTQIGTSPKIERANYDGSDRRTIVTSVDRPYAITLDLDREYHSVYSTSLC